MRYIAGDVINTFYTRAVNAAVYCNSSYVSADVTPSIQRCSLAVLLHVLDKEFINEIITVSYFELAEINTISCHSVSFTQL